jgi:hypothetical protein
MDEMADQSTHIQKQCEQQQDEAQKLLTVGMKLKEVINPVHEIKTEIDDATKIIGKMGQDPFYKLENQSLFN